MKTNKTKLKELRAELHHWQAQARMEARWLKMSRENCKKIGAMMRKLQQETS